MVLRNGCSHWAPVISGVPQGSITGPVFFLLYINDLSNVVSTQVKMFADDTKLYGPANNKEDCQKIQQDLNELSTWAQTWLLKFNSKKCTVLRLCESVGYAYCLNGDILKSVIN